MSRSLQDYYKRLLSKGFMYVEFIKKDGSLRKMWCTRDNRIVKECGHDLVQFGQGDILRRENKFINQVFVYDIQEDDVRILNVSTINDKSIIQYVELNEANIPRITQRFEKLAEERGVSVDEIKNAKIIEAVQKVESEVVLKNQVAEKAVDDLLGESDIEDIFN